MIAARIGLGGRAADGGGHVAPTVQLYCTPCRLIAPRRNGCRVPPPLTSPPESDSGLPRRGFLAAGAGAFLCTIGGERVLLCKPGDAAKADAAARRVAAPRARAAAAARRARGRPSS